MAKTNDEAQNAKGCENNRNENENIEVTFQNRVFQIFQEASEMCTIPGVKIAIIIFSPNGSVYSFGHPSIDETINHYLFAGGLPVNQPEEARCIETRQGWDVELTRVQELLEKEKERGKRLDDLRKETEKLYWWEGPDKDNLNEEQLVELSSKMEELLTKLNKKKAELSALEVQGGDGAVADEGKEAEAEADVGPCDGTKNENT